MVMSSFLMNSSPVSAYGSVADPKFPPTEEYSQGNYIPDYYASHNAAAAAANSAANQAAVVSVHHHHQGHHHPHYGYHHPIYGSSLQQDSSSLGLNSYGHHPSHSSSLHGHLPTHPTQSYYNPCTGSVVHSSHPSSHLSGQHVLSTHQPLSSLSSLSVGNNSSGSVRVPSPASSIPLHRTPSPRSQALAGLVDPPSPPDCGDSGSDSGQGSGPTVIYPWMKKVHINQGEFSLKKEKQLQTFIIFCWTRCSLD